MTVDFTYDFNSLTKDRRPPSIGCLLELSWGLCLVLQKLCSRKLGKECYVDGN